MAAPAPAGVPVLPEPEPTGAILPLWLVATCVAHAFGIYWLLRAFLAQFPGISLKALLKRRGRRHEEGLDGAGNKGSHSEQVIDVRTGPETVHEPVELRWQDVGYVVGTGQGWKSKVLLQGIWGSLTSGEVLALMGPSGAGKSTLLELLAMRRGAPGPSQSKVVPEELPSSQGSRPGICLNGTLATSSSVKAVSSYVPQDDVLLPQMTVWEVLGLHAALRLPRGASKVQKEARQREVLVAMGLSQQMHTLVGGVLPGGILLRGLSGGERKRLAIGTALIPSPKILFADEPTSGLDAFAALTVMDHLAQQAHGLLQCAVMVSIHQPRNEIWDMIDKVLLLAQGRMVYQGSTAGLLPWLSVSVPQHLGPPFVAGSAPFGFEPERHGTLTDWAMDLVSMTNEQLLMTATEGAGHPHLPQANEDPAPAAAATAAVAGSANSHLSTTSPYSWVASVADLFLATHTAQPATSNAPLQATRAPATDAVVESVTADQVTAAVTDASVVTEAAAQEAASVQASRSPAEHTAPVEEGAAAGHSGHGKPSTIPSSGDHGKPSTLLSKWLSFWSVFKVLVWREALAAVRNPADVAGRMLTFVWVAMIGNFLLYGGGVQSDTAASIRLRVGWTYFMLFFFMVMPFLFMSVFTADKRYYMADVTSKLYRPGPYYLAKLTATLPLNALISLAFILIEYGMFGNRHSFLAILQMSTLVVVYSLVSLQWMFFASAVSPSQDIAFILAVAFAVVNMLIHSFFFGPRDLTGLPWMRHLRYISAMDMAWQGCVTADLKDRTFSCAAGGDAMGVDALGLFPQFIPNTTSFQPLRFGLSNPGRDCIANANAVLQYYDVTPKVGMHISTLVLYLVILHVATYIAMRIATHRLSRASRGA